MIIGFSGKMGAGKDTAASMLSYFLFRAYYYTFEEYNKLNNVQLLPHMHPFAGVLKECAATLLDLPLSKMYDRNGKESMVPWLGMTVREVLQKFGTALRNELDYDLWVKALFNKYADEPHLLITDVRFKNEAEEIKKRGGLVIRINRPGDYPSQHISEIDLDDYDKFDCTIDNSGSLEDLFWKVRDLAAMISHNYS